MNRVAHLVGLASGATVAFFAGDIIKLLPIRVAAEECVDPPKYPWSHSGWLSSYDHARYTLYILKDFTLFFIVSVEATKYTRKSVLLVIPSSFHIGTWLAFHIH